MVSTFQDRQAGGAGLGWKAPVRAASVANLTLSAEQTVDGIALVEGDRVLVKDQTTAAQNGIYIVRSGAWDRAPDGDGNSDLVAHTRVPVVYGTVNTSTVWRLSQDNPIIVGIDDITFERDTGYRQGTFTPVLSFGGASVGITYTVQSGTYTLIGNLVHITLSITLSSKGSSTGSASVSGLPFSNLAAFSLPLNLRVNTVTSGVGDTHLTALIDASTTTVSFTKMAAGSATALTDADFTNSSAIRVTGTYLVSLS
jgi:hypothetical protein